MSVKLHLGRPVFTKLFFSSRGGVGGGWGLRGNLSYMCVHPQRLRYKIWYTVLFKHFGQRLGLVLEETVVKCHAIRYCGAF